MNYEEKKQMKIDRARELAQKAEQESQNRYKAARQTLDFIPMGQPILIGHHSEARHRRDLERIDNNMRKSIEADEKAKYYSEKADRLENGNTISSDDPNAIAKLEAKLLRLQANQELMKAANKTIRDKKLQEVEKVEKLVSLGLTEAQALEVMQPGRFQGMGFAGFQLSNNSQNIATVKQRIEHLKRNATTQKEDKEVNGIKIVDNVEDNRLQIFFPGIPPQETRTKLKSSGFRWSPSNGCWQAYRNNRSNYFAEQIVKDCIASAIVQK
jgi:hypothetical protein